MKNKSLIIIIIVAAVIFGVLIFSVYKITSKDQPIFYANGYVSMTTSEKTEKIYFNEGTTYKKGYNNEIKFKNSNNEDTEVTKYSFVFYDNKSIGFLSDGVLMDLNKVNDAFIPYYNIKSNYLIEYTSGLYTIHSSEKDIVLSNFISRITDEKFLVAGNDLRLKLSSSEEYINGDYFELIFSEGTDGNMVKIDNADMSLETISNESYILVGDHIKIDLSNRTILYDSEVKVNLDEIIIDHNENIDILYEDITVDDGGGSGEGEGEGDQPPAEAPEEDEPLEWTEQVETVVDYKMVPYVEILSSSANATSINLSFNVIDENALISGPVYVRYINKKTGAGRTHEYSNYANTIDYATGALEANTDYIVTIYTSYIKEGRPYGNHIMFQRTFTTSDMGVEIAKDYVTSTEIAYNINFEGTREFTSGIITLYDEEGNAVGANTFENVGSTTSVVFTELNPNKSYTAKIEKVMMDNVEYSLKDPIIATNKTLKYNPFTDALAEVAPIAIVNKKDYNFTFELGTIDDKNNAIKSVKYEIYNFEDNSLAKTLVKDHVNPIIVEIGDDLKKKTTYHYRAIVTMHDGEKEIDYVTMYSNTFNLSNKISPTMRYEAGDVSANSINGSFKIYDPDNAIDVNKEIYVEYYSATSEAQTVGLELIDCPTEEESTTKCANLNLIDLNPDAAYTINLMGYIDLESEDIPAGFDVIGSLKITTEKADVINTTMSATELDENESLQKFFELNLQFTLQEGTDIAVKDNMSGFDIFLYEGFDATGTYLGYIHVGENIANDYFDNQKVLTLADFGLTLQNLQEMHLLEGTKISKTYSIILRNGRSGADNVVFNPNILNFEINEVLLGLASSEASINVTEIKNSPSAGDYYDNTLNFDTTIGFKAVLDFGNREYANEINYIIYDVTIGEKITVIEETEKNIELEVTSPNPEKTFYFADYADKLKRGHTYVLAYTVGLDLNNDKNSDIVFPFSTDDISKPLPAESLEVDVYKQLPTMVLFAWTSDPSSITYKLDITDIDGSLPSGAPVKYEVADVKKNATYVDCPKSVDVKNFTSTFTCAKLEGLNNNDEYTILLEPKLLEKDGVEPARTEINTFTFESIYSDLSDVRFDMVVDEEGNSKYTNLVALQISETYDALTDEEKSEAEELKKRISYYTLTLTSETGEKFVINNINNSPADARPVSANIIEYYDGKTAAAKTTWNNTKGQDAALAKTAYVSLCEDEVSTCIYLDYSKLYNSETFKTTFGGFKNKVVSISASAVYDTGKVGYYANSNRNYTFQVKANEEIKYGSIVYNDYYFQVSGNRVNQSSFNPNAMATYYAYTFSSANGFVDDNVTDTGYSGSMTFANKAFNNLALASITSKFNLNYLITRKGVEVNVQNVVVPLVAKELGTTVITGENDFSYDKVIPGISVLGLPAPTVNGIKLKLQLSGLTEEDIIEEDGVKYLYLEVYSDKLVKTLKINKENITTQTGVIKNNEFVLKADDDYKFDIVSVSIEGVAASDYNYDYKTGKFTFEGIADDTPISVEYKLVIDDLNSSSQYSLKAYMNMGKNGTKNYLVDVASPTYAAYVYNFTTLAPTDTVISNAAFNIQSLIDYKTRKLITTYNISDIVGIDNLSYKICDATGSVCVDTTNYTKCSGSYNNFEGTCFENSNGYTAEITHDISITDDFDFIFGTNYNLVISADITEENGNNTYEIYNGAHSVKALENPSLKVTKDSNQKNNNFYLTFSVEVTDPDRVVAPPTEGEENGHYVAYLVDGNRNKVENVLDKDGNVTANEKIIEIAPDGKVAIANLYYGGLQADSSYYLMIEYRTYRNNEGLTPKLEEHAIPYLIYTLDNDNVSVGMIDYIATDNLTTLRFGYATNIMKRYIPNPEGTGSIPDPDQEAYVGGIAYTIRRLSGDATFEITGTLMFDDNNKITYVTGDTSSTEIGDEYYQMQIKDTKYTDEAFYVITFRFYLGGNVTAGLTEATCRPDESSTNKWHNGECFTLGNITYTADALYGGGAAK